ncbi:MAG TPA: ATP-binding protein [Thermoleophilaceae bacterium]
MGGAEVGLKVEQERWGDDPRLVGVLGRPGAEGFRAVLDGFPELVGVLWAIRDDEGRIVDFAFGYGNPAILRSFRLPAATPDRYTLLQALPQMRDSTAFRAYTRVVDFGEPWVQEITYDTPFGDGYMLGTFVERTMKLGDGLVTFLTDVTEQRRMEAELRSYAEVVAHDLREPIMAMALLVTLLERHASEPPPPEVLEQLHASNARARELIDCVLAYARVGILQIEPVALSALMHEVEQDLRARLDEERATIEAGDLPEIEGDPQQLRRVLQNLVANSLKFRTDAPPHVEVSAQRGSREWIVSVRDNGIGVEPSDASRIFGLFSRGSHSGADGIGIGLAMCRRIVEAHGGRIWVEPAEGGGSAFRFTLPHTRAK